MHNQTKKGRNSIVSFSSQMCSATTIIDGASPAKSMNILTWQQYIGEENRTNIFPAIKKILEEIQTLIINGIPELPDVKIHYYELHDGKMLYLLTQHSLFNRKHFPFLLCTCGRGEGVINEDHECKFVSHTMQEEYWDRSLRRWDEKRQKVGEMNYHYFDHMKWIDINNCGISHFGFHPKLLNRDSIRFDVLHLRCSITRRLMTNLQYFMSTQTPEILREFSILLLTFWNDYKVLIWNLNKPFQAFVGAELLSFITNSPKIILFLKNKFEETDILKDLCDGLELWQKITPFLVITTIKNIDKYDKLKKLL